MLADFQEALREFRTLQHRLQAMGISTKDLVSSSSPIQQAAMAAEGQAGAPSSSELAKLTQQYVQLKGRLCFESPRLRQKLREDRGLRRPSKKGSGAPGERATASPGFRVRV
jgi:hypothetical protein